MTIFAKGMEIRIFRCFTGEYDAGNVDRGKFSKLPLPHLIIFFLSQLSFIVTKTSPVYLYLFLSILFLFQGLNSLELAAHLEHKVVQLRQEGLGCIKMALTSTDTSSLLNILQAHFGQADLSESEEEEMFGLEKRRPLKLLKKL